MTFHAQSPLLLNSTTPPFLETHTLTPCGERAEGYLAHWTVLGFGRRWQAGPLVGASHRAREGRSTCHWPLLGCDATAPRPVTKYVPGRQR